VSRFLDHLQVGTINNYYTIADFHTTNHAALVSSVYFHLFLLANSSPQWLLLCSIFTRRFLVTNLINGDSSASVVPWLTLHNWTLNLLAVEVTLRLTFSQSVLVSSPIWDSWSDIYYCLTFTVLSLCHAISDERTDLFFVRVIACSNKSYVIT
jgi:hypothetical protein